MPSADSPVLITGETGTGKNVEADAIHYNRAAAREAFISVNCAALPVNLLGISLSTLKRKVNEYSLRIQLKMNHPFKMTHSK